MSLLIFLAVGALLVTLRWQRIIHDRDLPEWATKPRYYRDFTGTDGKRYRLTFTIAGPELEERDEVTP